MGSQSSFRWLFITQYLYFLVLVVSNRSICIQSPALRKAYNLIISTVGGSGGGSGSGGAAAATGRSLSSSVELCVSCQTTTQLIFGLWIPCLMAYQRELEARREFLKSRVGAEVFRSIEPSLPSSHQDMLIYIMPALVFPWFFIAFSGAHLEDVFLG